VLVPAHNEEAGIAAVLAALRMELKEGDRVLVVADNCSDATADIARAAGAQVCERTDPVLRGKGYALDFGVRELAKDAPEVVAIVDADCLVERGAIRRIAALARETGRPVQALYLMYMPPDAGPLRKIAEFAWLVKNLVRPLGFYRLGLPCQLMGTGMAFSWAQISGAELATGHIVEDMKLGVDLAKMGQPPLFCPDALVYSYFPSTVEGEQSQRTRWEHGHLSVILTQAPALLKTALARGNLALAGLALDLCVPPVALLTALVGLALVLTLIAYAAFALVAPLALAVVLMLCMALSILLAWAQYGREVVSFFQLLMAVAYVLGKIPLYLKFMVSRQVEWVRSKRDAE
jgi:cellulose synthase/poly-beta-1,6-N-acetylglucosamine synthase-like glycosyltransferase